MVFAGNYGQTFFISIFTAEWRQAFQLSHTELSAYYSFATLASGFLIMFVGGRIDTTELKTFSLWVLVGTTVACVLLATAGSVVALVLGFFLIRFCGQGLSCHAAYTSMARYFDANRGKAISIAALAMPVGEFVLPIAGAIAITEIGWRWSWGLLAISIPLVFLPLVLWSLRDARIHSPQSQTSSQDSESKQQRQWQRSEVIRDIRFWIAIPAILAPPFLVTGLFFHQTHWAQEQGWALSSLASSLMVYAVTHAISSFISGPIVDRLGVAKMLRLYLLPMTLSMAVLAASNEFTAWVLFMALAGLSVGASGPVVGSLWPKIYGTEHLGSIRSLVTALMIFSTAIAPILLGIFIDAHYPMASIMGLLLLYSIGTLLVCQWVYQPVLKTNTSSI
nr:MFS transporter [Pleionea sp. CnH1-48]